MDGYPSYFLSVDPKGKAQTMVHSPNYMSKHHKPIDMGIIAVTKLHYRRRFLSVRVPTMAMADTMRAQVKEHKMTAGTARLAEGQAAHVLDAAELLEAAWGDILMDTIVR